MLQIVKKGGYETRTTAKAKAAVNIEELDEMLLNDQEQSDDYDIAE